MAAGGAVVRWNSRYVWAVEVFVGGAWVPKQGADGNPVTYYTKRQATFFAKGVKAIYKEPAVRVSKYEVKS